MRLALGEILSEATNRIPGAAGSCANVRVRVSIFPVGNDVSAIIVLPISS